MNTKIITLLIALFALAACNSKPSTKEAEVKAEPVTEVFHVEGMTCDHCEESVQKGVAELPGIQLVEANYEDSTTKVVYDPSLVDETQIKSAIEKRGYTVGK